MSGKINDGDIAPDFCLPNQYEEKICLKDYKGKKFNYIFLSERQYSKLFFGGYDVYKI